MIENYEYNILTSVADKMANAILCRLTYIYPANVSEEDIEKYSGQSITINEVVKLIDPALINRTTMLQLTNIISLDALIDDELLDPIMDYIHNNTHMWINVWNERVNKWQHIHNMFNKLNAIHPLHPLRYHENDYVAVGTSMEIDIFEDIVCFTWFDIDDEDYSQHTISSNDAVNTFQRLISRPELKRDIVELIHICDTLTETITLQIFSIKAINDYLSSQYDNPVHCTQFGVHTLITINNRVGECEHFIGLTSQFIS